MHHKTPLLVIPEAHLGVMAVMDGSGLVLLVFSCKKSMKNRTGYCQEKKKRELVIGCNEMMVCKNRCVWKQLLLRISPIQSLNLLLANIGGGVAIKLWMSSCFIGLSCHFRSTK